MSLHSLILTHPLSHTPSPRPLPSPPLPSHPPPPTHTHTLTHCYKGVEVLPAQPSIFSLQGPEAPHTRLSCRLVQPHLQGRGQGGGGWKGHVCVFAFWTVGGFKGGRVLTQPKGCVSRHLKTQGISKAMRQEERRQETTERQHSGRGFAIRQETATLHFCRSLVAHRQKTHKHTHSSIPAGLSQPRYPLCLPAASLALSYLSTHTRTSHARASTHYLLATLPAGRYCQTQTGNTHTHTPTHLA